MATAQNPDKYMLNGISPKTAHRIAVIAALTVFILAIAAAVLSYSGLYTLASQSGFAPALAGLFPIVIDGMVLVGSVGVLYSTLAGISVVYPWFLMLLGVAFSVVGNVAVAPPTTIARVFHALPPIVFALSCEELMRVYRHRIAVSEVLEAAPTLVDASPTFHGGVPSYERRAGDRRVSSVTVEGKPVLGPPPPVPSRGAVTTPEVSVPVVESRPVEDDGSGEFVPSPPHPVIDNRDLVARERLVALKDAFPTISGAKAARRLGLDKSHVSKMLRELRAAEGEDADTVDASPSDVVEASTEGTAPMPVGVGTPN